MRFKNHPKTTPTWQRHRRGIRELINFIENFPSHPPHRKCIEKLSLFSTIEDFPHNPEVMWFKSLPRNRKYPLDLRPRVFFCLGSVCQYVVRLWFYPNLTPIAGQKYWIFRNNWQTDLRNPPELFKREWRLLQGKYDLKFCKFLFIRITGERFYTVKCNGKPLSEVSVCIIFSTRQMNYMLL